MMTSLLLLASWWGAASAAPGLPSVVEPVRVVEETVPLPPGLTVEEALASVDDIPRIFELYEPAIPRIPGVEVALTKQVVSLGAPAVLELPVSGNAIGYRFDERARVTATTEALVCEGDGAEGRRITLDFQASSYNIERRIDRIEITACPERDRDGATVIRAIGRMYEGFNAQDPSKPGLSETIGRKALQTAFIRQVTPILTAVQAHWSML